MNEIRIAEMTPDELETLFINCLKAFYKYNPTENAATDNTTAPDARKVLNVDQLCEYAGLKKSTLYKLTANGSIPHSKRGKRLFFDRGAVEAWLLSNQRGTRADAEAKADEFLLNAPRRTR